MTRTEYDCARCGIRVIHAIPQPVEMTWCMSCRFIESIDEPEAREEAARFLDARNPDVRAGRRCAVTEAESPVPWEHRDRANTSVEAMIAEFEDRLPPKGVTMSATPPVPDPTPEDLARDLAADLAVATRPAPMHPFALAAESRWPAAIRRALAAEAELARLRTHTYCAYCGHAIEMDADASLISEHIATCPAHPMRAVEAEVKRLQALHAAACDRIAQQSELLARTATKDGLRDLVLDMRRYIIHHGLLMGECVAWNDLKALVGVGQTADCPSEKGPRQG